MGLRQQDAAGGGLWADNPELSAQRAACGRDCGWPLWCSWCPLWVGHVSEHLQLRQAALPVACVWHPVTYVWHPVAYVWHLLHMCGAPLHVCGIRSLLLRALSACPLPPNQRRNVPLHKILITRLHDHAGELPELELGLVMYLVLGGATVSKLVSRSQGQRTHCSRAISFLLQQKKPGMPLGISPASASH